MLDNPFLVTPYRSADGRWVMACGVYPRMVAQWCRFLNVPPDPVKVANAIARWDAFELEEAATSSGLPVCVVRSSAEWMVHEQGALLAVQPVIELTQSATPRLEISVRVNERSTASACCRSRTPSRARPSVEASRSTARTCCARPVRTTTNTSSSTPRPTWDPAAPTSTSTRPRARTGRSLSSTSADVIVNNHRAGSLERRGLDPHLLAERLPGLVYVSVSCYGSTGPWARRGGFDMNASAASGLMTCEGSESEPKLPVTTLINDYVTGYMGALGATAALVKRATEGGILARERQPDEVGDVVCVARTRRS